MLVNHYTINTHHQRSARLDADLTADFFRGFIYHGTAQSTLETLLRQYGQGEQKAFTITGAYGSGKSCIALLIAGLLHQDKIIRQAARDKITDSSRKLLDKTLPQNKGYLVIKLVGGANNPAIIFWHGIISAVQQFSSSGLNNIFNWLKEQTPPADEAALIANFKELLTKLSGLVDGVFILADEMG
ncbi:MAG: hypothetical protein ACRCUZ_02275, partial [Shewanella sp.]